MAPALFARPLRNDAVGRERIDLFARKSRDIPQHRLVVLAEVSGVPDRHRYSRDSKWPTGVSAKTARPLDRLYEFALLQMRIRHEIRCRKHGAGAYAVGLQ